MTGGAYVWHRGGLSPHAKLVFPGDGGGFGMTLPTDGDPRPYALSGVALCLDRSGRVVLKKLVPQGGNGEVEVLDFATRAHLDVGAYSSDGASRKPLTQFGFPRTTPVVAVPCPKDPTKSHPGRVIFYELGAQFQRTGSGPGTFTSLQVVYTSGGRDHTMTIPWALKLCGPEGKTTETCQSDPTPSGGG